MVVARVSGRGGGVDRRDRRQHSAHGHRRGCGVCGLGGGPVRCQRPLPPQHLALHHSSSVDAGLDHSMIFLLIAGTYTPIAMLALPPGHPHRRAGRGLGRAVAGMMLKLVWPHAPRWVSVLMYLVLGWVAAPRARRPRRTERSRAATDRRAALHHRRILLHNTLARPLATCPSSSSPGRTRWER